LPLSESESVRLQPPANRTSGTIYSDATYLSPVGMTISGMDCQIRSSAILVQRVDFESDARAEALTAPFEL
jgi:hypothetical protein